jgi:hypothetical protein
MNIRELFRILCGIACASTPFLVASPARAQAEDQAAARALFQEARRLLHSGQSSAACQKFEAADKLYKSTGILLNLAECFEETGRTASAWTTFGEAVSVAGRQGRTDDVIESKRRQKLLEPRLTRLAIRVAHEEPGLKVKRDGFDVPAAVWNEPLPVDPGAHEIRAEAPGCDSWTQSIEVAQAGKTITVDVPALVPTARPVAHAALVPPPGGDVSPTLKTPPEAGENGSPPGKTQRLLGLVMGGAGVVGLGVAGVLALVAKSEYDSARSENGPMQHTDSVNAEQLADAASVTLAVGAAAVVTGAVLWWTAPKAPVTVGIGARGLFVSGSFQ